MTRLVEWQAEEQRRVKADKNTRISTFAFIIKMVSLALKDFPQLKASIDERSDSLIHKHYLNIGIAVDTKAGLVVPSIAIKYKQQSWLDCGLLIIRCS